MAINTQYLLTQPTLANGQESGLQGDVNGNMRVSVMAAPGLLSGGNIPVMTSPSQGTYTDRSGPLVTGGVSQTVMASNTSRKGFVIQNTSSANLWIQHGATSAVQASPSLLIPPGAMAVPLSEVVSTEAIQIIGPNNGQTYTAWEI